MQLRNFTIAFYCMVFALFTSASAYAQSFNVAVTNASVDCSGTPQLTFTLTATSNVDYLVDNWNIWLNFNPAALSNPQITFAPGFTGNYGTGVEPQSNYIQFNSFWNGAANAQSQTFSAAPTTLCTITFTVLNSALPSGLNFEAAQTFGSDNNFNEYSVANSNIFGGVSLACPAGPCAISGITAGVATACVPATNTYTQAVTVTYANPPASGSLTVNGQNFAITSSPQTVILTGLTANGASVNVTASFTATPACTFTANNLFTAPASCAPTCTISGITAGTQTACVPATNNYTQQVTVTYANAPGSGQLTVNGQNFAITGSPQTVTLTNLPSDGGAVSVTASFTASPACTFTANNLFTAPASCAPVCTISSITAGTPSACNPATNTYSVQVTVTFSNPPAVGNLLVNAGSGNQTFTGIGTSPRTVTLTNLPATGNPVNVTASFSTNPGCVLTVNSLFTAPANCTPVCTISSLAAGTQTACNPANNTYTQQVIVTYSTPPASGQLTVNGQNFAITGSPQTVTLTGLTANGNAVNVNASFTANPSCSLAQSALFTAPASCAIVDPCAGVTVSGSASYSCTGGLSLSASGGSGNYSFTANGNAVVNGQLLSNGTYSIVATDDNGCSDASPFSLNVNSLTAITASYDCVTGLAVSAANGVGPFTYTANGDPVDLGDLLADGTITIEATDANGCSASSTFENTCNVCVGVDITVTASYDCENGLTVSATGGSGNYTFLANGIGVSNGSFLPDGTYTIVATDENGCTGSVGGVLADCGADPCSGVTINVSAVYSCATGLVVDATGGTGDLSFNLNDGAILSNGSYTIVATDENGCTGSFALTVDCISCAGVVIDVTAAYSCNSGLSVSATGGTGSYTITANGVVVTNGSILPQGPYNINVFDTNGCSGFTTLTVPAAIQLSASYSCVTGLSFSTSGGTGAVSVTTNQGTAVSNGSFLANGTYQLVATDSQGCVGNFVSFTVNCGGGGDPCDGVTISATASYSCATGLSVSASGGAGPYTFSTPNGATLANGSYTITATDANGCTGTASVTVSCGGGGDPCDGVTINVSASYSCATGLSVSATGGAAPYGFGPLAGTFLPEGVYIISATDANGCSGTTVLTVGNCNNPPIANPDAATVLQGTASVTVDVTTNDTDPDGDAITLVSAGPASAGGTVTNFTPDGNITVVVAPGFTGTITVPYTIQDSNGAQSSSTFTITVFGCAAEAGNISQAINYTCSNAASVQVSASGFNNTPGYSQNYLLVDGSGTIVAVSASGSISNPGSGTYSVYALNFATGSAPSFGVGTTLAALNAQAGTACFDLSAAAQVVVFAPVTLEVETFCDPTVDGGFFVRFTANGGFPAYANLGGYTTNVPPFFIPWNTSLGAAQVVSGPFPNGLPCFEADIINDGLLCTIGNVYVCPPEPCIIECTPEAGTMSTNLQAICDGGSASVISNNIEVDLTAGEVAFYVVHTSPNLADGGVVGVFPVPFDVTVPATFSLGDLTGGSTNTVYYVSAIVGRNDNDGDGLPDLGDICTDVVGSTPVVFLTPLQVDVQPICNDDTQEYTLVVAVTGSYPSFDPSASYTLFGDFTGEITSSILIPGYASGSEYFIGVTDAAGCSFTDNNLVTCKPTPITLLRFDGKVMTEGNLLNWTTATETDNDFFTLMRSTDGVTFTAVGVVDGAGNSIIARSYEFMDKNAPNGLSYYRLDQTDFDGTNTIASEVITLRRDAVKFSILEVVPVPTSGVLNVNFATGVASVVEYTIYDVAGRKIDTQRTNAQNGLNTLTLDVAGYAAGVYFITLNNGSDIQTTRFVKE